jgi:hypothetical protein
MTVVPGRGLVSAKSVAAVEDGNVLPGGDCRAAVYLTVRGPDTPTPGGTLDAAPAGVKCQASRRQTAGAPGDPR